MRSSRRSLRFQFRLVHLFAVVTLTAVVVAVSIAVYWRIVAPRTPIAWHACDLGEVSRLQGGRMDVIVVAGNWMITGSVYDVTSALDVAELRILSHRGTIRFHYCDVTSQQTLPKMRDMEAILGLTDNLPPYVVILDGRNRTVEVVRFDGDRKSIVARIVDAK